MGGLLRVVAVVEVAEKNLLSREYEVGLCCGFNFCVVSDEVQKVFLHPEPPISSSLFRRMWFEMEVVERTPPHRRRRRRGGGVIPLFILRKR